MKTQWTLDEIKACYWKTFHQSGEWWFDDLSAPADNTESTESLWREFLDNLPRE